MIFIPFVLILYEVVIIVLDKILVYIFPLFPLSFYSFGKIFLVHNVNWERGHLRICFKVETYSNMAVELNLSFLN